MSVSGSLLCLVWKRVSSLCWRHVIPGSVQIFQPVPVTRAWPWSFSKPTVGAVWSISYHHILCQMLAYLHITALRIDVFRCPFHTGMLGLISPKSLALSSMWWLRLSTLEELWTVVQDMQAYGESAGLKCQAQQIALSAMCPVLLLPGDLRAWCCFHNLFSKFYSISWKRASVRDPPLLSPSW